MSLLFTIVTAAYARGSHHKLALDGLKRLRGPDAEAWRRVFLKHAETFVAAAKIPDDEFKDFKNHVLHPRDGYWGGAPIAARKWYDTLIAELRAENWAQAVRAAGILSHYVVDPIHPFHTAQSEAENAIHRACEWSINRAYDGLRADGAADFGNLVLSAPADANWLTLMIGQGADKSNGQYEKLIAHYDITRGVIDPPSGLDSVSRRLMAELIHYAGETFAVVLAMALQESGARPPEISLTPDVLLAMIKIPGNQLLKKIENTAERKLVAAMYDELKATGTVHKTLTEDDRSIRDLYATEVQAKKKKIDVAKMFPLPALESSDATVVTLPTKGRKAAAKATAPDVEVAQPEKILTPTAVSVATPKTEALAPVSVSEPRAENVSAAESASRAAMATAAGLAGLAASTGASFRDARSIPSQPAMAPATSTPRTTRNAATLPLDADVVDAPSIGPKTAERLLAIGITRVSELLAGDSATIAKKLDTRWIGTTTVDDWKAQTKLATVVPGLRDTHTQLLVGAGYRDARTLADADPDQLAADVLAFAVSNEGRRLLRDSTPPDMDKVKSWLDAAKQALAA
ncbi:MAG: DUF4332 domain-containing protein [Hyphomicrobiaceae bacterium]|nr:DUF4332 domain-containing protein [Hyphomicrobiaceae bacterium]